MSDSGRPESPKKAADGQKRLGSLKFNPQSNRPGGLRMGAGEPSALRPMAIKVEEPTPAGQGTGPQAPAPAKPPIPRKAKFVPRMPARKDPLAAKAAAAVSAEAPGATARPGGGAMQNQSGEEHRDLLKAAAADKAWQRGGKNKPHSLEGRPKQQSFLLPLSTGSTPAERAAAVAARVAKTDARDGGTKGTSGSGSCKSTRKVKQEGAVAAMEEDGDEEDADAKESSKEVLDYSQYYPTLLPMRPRHASLDEDERAEAKPPDLETMPEGDTNVAQSLGLLETGGTREDSMFLLQLPALLPATGPPPGPPDKARPGRRDDVAQPPGALSLRDLPSGKIGRLLVYASGAVKLALGDVLLDVGLGTEAAFRQDLALVSAEDKECTFLGGVHSRAVACPDIGHLLGDDPTPVGLLGSKHGAQPVVDSDEEMIDFDAVHMVKDEDD